MQKVKLPSRSSTACTYFIFSSHHSLAPIDIIAVSCNSSSSRWAPQTTNICYSYSAETSAYRRPAASRFPSTQHTPSLHPTS
jgi:hypothetical protein